MIKVKSIYSKASAQDGERILVDLFWPEGVKTREARVDQWLSGLGPSYDLQRFHWDLSDWDSYRSKFEGEVLSDREKRRLLEQIAEKAREKDVTLLYGNRDATHNHAMILKQLIENNLSRN